MSDLPCPKCDHRVEMRTDEVGRMRALNAHLLWEHPTTQDRIGLRDNIVYSVRKLHNLLEIGDTQRAKEEAEICAGFIVRLRYYLNQDEGPAAA